MIVRSLEVEGVRCFADRVRIDFAPQSFTILSGPNGSGKSTLVEAMRRCLLDAHASTAAADLKPWNDGRPPRIAIEFDHGGERYLLTKQFLSRKQARLERKDGRSWRIAREGREADDAVREMLKAAGRGDAGMLGVLWSPQGQLPLNSVSGGVLEAIRASLGAQMAGAGGAAFEKQVARLFEAGWQPARRQPKKGRLHEIDEQLAGIRQTAANARDSLREADEHAAAAGETRRSAAELAEKLAAVESQLASATARAEERDLLAQAAAALHKDHDQQERLFQELWRRADSIRLETERRGRLEATAPELVTRLDETRRLEKAARVSAEAAQAAAALASRLDPEIETARATADAATEWVRVASELAVLERKRDRLAHVSSKAAALRAEPDLLRAPDAGALKRIREAMETHKLALVRLEKLGLRLELQAETAAEIDVIRGNPRGGHRLAHGDRLSVRGDDLSVRLPGILEIRVAGPETDRKRWEQEAAAAELELRELCAPFGERDPGVLSERSERRASLEADLRALEQGRTELLAGQSEAQVRESFDLLSARMREIERDHPEWRACAPDPGNLRKLAEDRAMDREERMARAQSESAKAAGELLKRQEERQSAEHELARNRGQLEECLGRLRDLESDGKTAGRRGQELEEVRRLRDASAEQLAAARDRLAQIPADARAVADSLSSQAGELRRAIAEAARAAAERDTIRRTLLSLGPYTSLAEAEEEIDSLEQQRHREILRLDAIRLLFETLEEEKRKALEGISEPVSARATAILREIAGSPFAELKLSADFSQTSVFPVAKGSEAKIAETSGGEQEQIALAVRLALAGYLAESEPHLVVLDDVLLNTDSERLARILALLDEVRERMQFLILTCHPDRYRRLRGARHVSLPLAAAAVAE
jgi:chromosome segregation ATPase